MSGPKPRKPDRSAPTGAPRLIHAGELARLAGLHKTTVLQAVRRGEIRVSRTVGRSVRIAMADAATFLHTRGIVLDEALPAPPEPRRVVFVTERADAHRRFADNVPPHWALGAHLGLYDTLLSLGAQVPTAVALDLDLLGINPVHLVQALRADPRLSQVPLFALSHHDPLPDAAIHGVDAVLPARDPAAWQAALTALD